MKIKTLITFVLLCVAFGYANAEPFWDVGLGVENQNNWNRAARQRGERDDTIYQADLKYGYSQALSGLSGLLYGVSLERHQWKKYELLNNTALETSISYQRRLSPSLQSPWISLNGALGYTRYRDPKRRGNQLDLSADVGQSFTHWQYQASAGWKKNSARDEAFSTEASYLTFGAGIKASNSLTLGMGLGFEHGDIVSSGSIAAAPARFIVKTRDDAFGSLNWQAYRLNADTLWQELFISYGWKGQHDLRLAIQAYDSEGRDIDYQGETLSFFYTRLF